MAQINLLKQNNSVSSFAQFSPKILVQVMGGIFVILLGYYGFLFFNSKSIDSKVQATQIEIQAAQSSAASVPHKEELFIRQQQIKGLKDLIAGHLYWSQIFKPLADVTLRSAVYSSIKLTTANTLSLEVKVPNLEQLDKFTQVFNLPQFNKNFSNVRIGSYAKSQGTNSTSIIFTVQMDYNPQLLVYKSDTFLGR